MYIRIIFTFYLYHRSHTFLLYFGVSYLSLWFSYKAYNHLLVIICNTFIEMIFYPIDFLFVTIHLVFTTIDRVNEEPKTSYAVNFIIVATFFFCF